MSSTIFFQSTIGLLGGTFDPFHLGHLELASSIYYQLQLKEIRLIPCAQPSLRNTPAATAEQRLQMVKIAAQDYSWLCVDDREIKRGSVSYTIDTVRELRLEMPNIPLCFIMSMDQFLQFNRWQSWKEILETVHLIVASRPEYKLEMLNEEMKKIIQQHQIHDAHLLHEKIAGTIFFESISALPISGTEIRTRIKAGEDARNLVPEKVWEYICENKLYS